jgi:L-fuconolactonase
MTIVIDYLGPDAFRGEAGVQALHRLGAVPSVWYKLLALGTDSQEKWPFADLWPLYREAFESFGPGRLVYGTNFPHVYHSSTYAEGVRWLNELPFLDDAARAAISDSSARTLWGLPATI